MRRVGFAVACVGAAVGGAALGVTASIIGLAVDLAMRGRRGEPTDWDRDPLTGDPLDTVWVYTCDPLAAPSGDRWP